MSKILEGKIIVLTRSKKQCQEPADWLKNLGADVVCFPCIETVPVDDLDNLKILLESGQPDFIIFSSTNAIKYYHEAIDKLGLLHLINQATIIAVGTKTQEACEHLGINVNHVPDKFSARGILEKLSEYDLKSKKILLPSSDIAREELREGLVKMGAKVYAIPVYKTVIPDKDKLKMEASHLASVHVDMYIFTSPSTYNNFLILRDVNEPTEYFKNCAVAVIGETTQKAVEDTGVSVDIVPETFTMNSLLEKIIEYYRKGKDGELL